MCCRLALHHRLDSVLAEAVSTTYYFLDWRDFMPVSAIILNQHGLLPDDAEIDEVGCGLWLGGQQGLRAKGSTSSKQ